MSRDVFVHVRRFCNPLGHESVAPGTAALTTRLPGLTGAWSLRDSTGSQVQNKALTHAEQL